MPEPPDQGAPATLPAILLLAESWAQKLGLPVTRGSEEQAGRLVHYLLVQNGPFQVILQEGNGLLVVLMVLDFPPDLRTKLRRLAKDTQEKTRFAMQDALLRSDRSAYAILPLEGHTLDAIERIVLDQKIAIKEEDAGTFNRFADAIQEITTAGVRVSQVISPLGAPSTTASAPDGKHVPGYA